MRKDELENYYTIMINGEEVPIAYTLIVMREIIKKYGTIEEFLGKIYRPKGVDEKTGILTMELPDIDAIYTILPMMVNEGVYLVNESRRNKIDAYDADFIYRHYETRLHDIGLQMFNEITRSIKSPKRTPLTATSQK